MFADIAMFQIVSNCNLLAPALGASFFSAHFVCISSAGASVISTVNADVSFEVFCLKVQGRNFYYQARIDQLFLYVPKLLVQVERNNRLGIGNEVP